MDYNILSSDEKNSCDVQMYLTENAKIVAVNYTAGLPLTLKKRTLSSSWTVDVNFIKNYLTPI